MTIEAPGQLLKPCYSDGQQPAEQSWVMPHSQVTQPSCGDVVSPGASTMEGQRARGQVVLRLFALS